MIELTMDQIAAAQANDLEATSAVLAAMEERVTQLANAKADFETSGGAEDIAQEGRLAMWQALPRFRGSTVAEFFVFMSREISGEMNKARIRSEGGVSPDAMKRFERAVRIAGGADEAREAVQDRDRMGNEFRTLSRELAYAAHAQYTRRGVSLDCDDSAFYDSMDAAVYNDFDILDETFRGSEAAHQMMVNRVHVVLDGMGENQRIVLKALTGVTPVARYGALRDDSLAADYGLPRERISSTRRKGKDSFAKRYTKAYPEGAPRPVTRAAEPENKTCVACERTRDADDFGSSRSSEDGMRDNCIPCEKRHVRLHIAVIARRTNS